MPDRRLARQLGASGRGHIDYLARAVALERSGEYDRAVPAGRTRCEAGLVTKVLLRCPRVAGRDRRWCWQHDPEPPAPPPVAIRPADEDLRYRPDGEVLRAVFEMTDRVDQLAGLVNATLARLERLEQRALEPGPQTLWTVPEAANYLGVTRHSVYAMVREARLPFVRLGRSIRLRPADLEEHVAGKARPEARRKRAT